MRMRGSALEQVADSVTPGVPSRNTARGGVAAVKCTKSSKANVRG